MCCEGEREAKPEEWIEGVQQKGIFKACRKLCTSCKEVIQDSGPIVRCANCRKVPKSQAMKHAITCKACAKIQGKCQICNGEYNPLQQTCRYWLKGTCVKSPCPFLHDKKSTIGKIKGAKFRAKQIQNTLDRMGQLFVSPTPPFCAPPEYMYNHNQLEYNTYNQAPQDYNHFHPWPMTSYQPGYDQCVYYQDPKENNEYSHCTWATTLPMFDQHPEQLVGLQTMTEIVRTERMNEIAWPARIQEKENRFCVVDFPVDYRMEKLNISPRTILLQFGTVVEDQVQFGTLAEDKVIIKMDENGRAEIEYGNEGKLKEETLYHFFARYGVIEQFQISRTSLCAFVTYKESTDAHKAVVDHVRNQLFLVLEGVRINIVWPTENAICRNVNSNQNS